MGAQPGKQRNTFCFYVFVTGWAFICKYWEHKTPKFKIKTRKTEKPSDPSLFVCFLHCGRWAYICDKTTNIFEMGQQTSDREEISGRKQIKSIWETKSPQRQLQKRNLKLFCLFFILSLSVRSYLCRADTEQIDKVNWRVTKAPQHQLQKRKHQLFVCFPLC